ncbi:hypothetical protein L596_015945 [Steinernema carpocapsae]|uniref:Uncharacterized protein n=1 Tax=Steinernema carpocapsae TaxID=34508 RepID=A0A4U5NHI7_STECR|nr:hypothetical protein L596_015945 [Steinernema carpocapsae]
MAVDALGVSRNDDEGVDDYAVFHFERSEFRIGLINTFAEFVCVSYAELHFLRQKGADVAQKNTVKVHFCRKEKDEIGSLNKLSVCRTMTSPKQSADVHTKGHSYVAYPDVALY